MSGERLNGSGTARDTLKLLVLFVLLVVLLAVAVYLMAELGLRPLPPLLR